MGVLEGKAVVVTGAGRGLGRAYALDAAAHGAAVVVNDIDSFVCEAVVEEIRARGGTAIAHPASVTEWQSAADLVDGCVREFGKLDGLVANAGLYYSTAPWEDSEERIRRTVEVNVIGAIFCNVHALRQMTRQRAGAIVNVTSGSQAGMPGIATYGATKGALASYTYSAALDARSHNVRVNAISPLASTRMGATSAGGLSDTVPDTEEVANSIALRATALSGPESIAPLVTFLLSDLAADVTGQVIRLSMGHLALFEHPRVLPSGHVAETWTPTSIAEAFNSALRDKLSPVGFGEDQYIGPA